jgi:adenine-specific DNA methylase
VISLTAGHQARVEEKPEVRKAGGVYYTPTYIVDYIVKNTVDKLLEGKSPKDIAKLRILDPACGSGSFLIVAYQHLLDWHLDRYVKDDPQKHKKELYQAGVKDWRLTTAERKRILLNNIYGVDIDPQAVEVTKLSLLLKVLEGENQQTLDKQFKLFHERALPDLAQNIKCGNSLIGSDFYEQQQMTLPCAEERYHINVFDWQTEFTPIFKTGGFDAVIGNPPYIRSQSLGDDQRMYYGRKFQTATATYDIYVLFVERALSLISKHGRVGFILPNKFFTTDYGVGLRNLLTKPNRIERIVDFEDGQVFSGAGTYTCLLFMTSQVSGEIDYVRFGTVFREQGENGVATLLKSGKLGFEKLTFAAGGERWTLAVGAIGRLLTKLQKNYPPFSSLQPHIFQGLKTSADKTYLLTVKSIKGGLCEVETDGGDKIRIEREILKPVVKGEHVQRYFIDRSSGLHIIYPYRISDEGRAVILSQAIMTKEFPFTWEYLKANKAKLCARDGGIWGQRSDWYAYARSQNLSAFLGEKLLLPYMTTRLRVAPDSSGELFFVNITTGGYGMRFDYGKHDSFYVVGILNSKLLDCAIRQMTSAFRGGYFAVNKQGIERLPFRSINFSDRTDKSRHDRLVKMVKQMLDLNHQLTIAKTLHEKTTLQRQIAATDQQIDKLVYELYGLTEEEIKIVEESTDHL